MLFLAVAVEDCDSFLVGYVGPERRPALIEVLTA